MGSSADQVVILVNRSAGCQAVEQEVSALARQLHSRQYQVQFADHPPEAAARANQSHLAGRLRALVAVGGDGTAAELANRTEPGVPLALFPTGTENLLARYLGIRRSADDLCHIICSGQVRRLDAGRAGNRLFLIMASCGFDAAVVARVHRRRKRSFFGRLSYPLPILECLRSYGFPEIEVECLSAGGETLSRDTARWAFVFNVPRYGGGLRIMPQADPEDGQFDVGWFRPGNSWNDLGHIAAIYLGQHQKRRQWTMCRSSRVRLSCPSAAVSYQLDGDPGGQLPVEIEILPKRLTLLVP